MQAEKLKRQLKATKQGNLQQFFKQFAAAIAQFSQFIEVQKSMQTSSIEKTTLSAEVLAFTNKLVSLDLGPIAYKLMHPDEGRGWTKGETVRAISEYMKFLLLIYLYPNSEIVPTQEVDRVWHHHILDTAKYAEDCQFLFGRFVHHFPYLGLRDDADLKQLYHDFAQTQQLFNQHFNNFNIPVAESQSFQPSFCVFRNVLDSHRPSVSIEFDPFEVLGVERV